MLNSGDIIIITHVLVKSIETYKCKFFTENERQDMRNFVQRIDNEVRDLKVTNRSNNANTQPQRFNSSLYVIEQLDTMGEIILLPSVFFHDSTRRYT